MHEGGREPCRRNVLGRGTEAAEAPRTGSGEGFPGLCPVGQRQEFGVDSKCTGLCGSLFLLSL